MFSDFTGTIHTMLSVTLRKRAAIYLHWFQIVVFLQDEIQDVYILSKC